MEALAEVSSNMNMERQFIREEPNTTRGFAATQLVRRM